MNDEIIGSKYKVVNIIHTNNNPDYQLQLFLMAGLDQFLYEEGTYRFKATFSNKNNEWVSHYYFYQVFPDHDKELYHNCKVATFSRNQARGTRSSSRYITVPDYGDPCFQLFYIGTSTVDYDMAGFYGGDWPELSVNDNPYEDIMTLEIKYVYEEADFEEGFLNFNRMPVDQLRFNNNYINVAYLNDKVIFRKITEKNFITYDSNGGDQQPNPKNQHLRYGLDYVTIAENTITNSNLPTQENVTFTLDANGGTCSRATDTLTATWTNYPNGWTNPLYSQEMPGFIFFNKMAWYGYLGHLDLYAAWSRDYNRNIAFTLPTAQECTKPNSVLKGWTVVPVDYTNGLEDYIYYRFKEPGTQFYYWQEGDIPKTWYAVWDDLVHVIISHKAVEAGSWTTEEFNGYSSGLREKLSEINNSYADESIDYDIKIDYLALNN